MTRRPSHPGKCPRCGSPTRMPILYGLVCESEIIAKAEHGEIVLGGCCITGHDPQWQCSACGYQWGAADDHDPSNLE